MTEYRIKDICDINLSTLSSADSLDNILYLDTSNLTQNVIGGFQSFALSDAPSRAQRRVKHETILYSSVRPNQGHHGILSHPDKNIIVSTGFITLDIKKEKKDEINAQFLYYMLTQNWVTSYLQTIAENSVSSYPSINPSDLGNLLFRFPKIEIQQQIVSTLKSIDNKISLNRQIKRQLETFAKQVYDYWFVQFDFPDLNGNPYNSSGGEMEWNVKLKRMIPRGWTNGTLLDIATYTNGIACQNYRPTGEQKLPVIKIKEMHGGFSSETEYVRSDIPDSVKVFNGDVLFSWSASLEVLLWSYGEGGLNQHIFKVTSKNGFPRSFYFFQLLDYVLVFKRMAEARKTTMGHITRDHLEQSTIVIPPSLDLPNRLEELLSPLFQKIVHAQVENDKLTTIKNDLLPLLMNGQVSVN